jgi:hypothetical protein
METHEVYLEMLHYLPSIRQGNILIHPMYATTVTHLRWLRPVKFTLEGIVAAEVGVPVLSHNPHG